MYKVKCFPGQWLGENVMAQDFQVRRIDGAEKMGLKVRRDDAASGPDLAAEPFSY